MLPRNIELGVYGPKGLNTYGYFVYDSFFGLTCNSRVHDSVLKLNPRYDSGRTHPYHPNRARF